MSTQHQVGGTLIEGRQRAIEAAIEWWATACGTQRAVSPEQWDGLEMLRGWCVAPEGEDQDALDSEVIATAEALRDAAIKGE